MDIREMQETEKVFVIPESNKPVIKEPQISAEVHKKEEKNIE